MNNIGKKISKIGPIVVVVILVFIALIVCYVNNDDGVKEDLCLCTGYGRNMCADRIALRQSYLGGRTENTDFAEIQKRGGGPRWKDSIPFLKYF